MIAELAGFVGSMSGNGDAGGAMTPDMLSQAGTSGSGTISSGGIKTGASNYIVLGANPQNIGEILKPYNEGSLQNGGNPASLDRYSAALRPSTLTTLSQAAGQEMNYTPIIVAAIAGLGLLLIMKKGGR